MFTFFEKLPEEVKALVLKTIIPGLIAVSIKLAIQAKQAKVTWVQIIVSFITGIGFAYLFADYVNETFSHPWQPMVTAMVAISGEKIGYWLVYKFKPESLFDFMSKKK